MKKTYFRQPSDALIWAIIGLIIYGFIAYKTSVPPIVANEFKVKFFTFPIIIPKISADWWIAIIPSITFGTSLLIKLWKYLSSTVELRSGIPYNLMFINFFMIVLLWLVFNKWTCIGVIILEIALICLVLLIKILLPKKFWQVLKEKSEMDVPDDMAA